MALALTEEHLALAESVRGWAGRAAPAEALRAAVADGDGGAALYTGTLRPALAGQGLLGLHLPESLGGQGYGLPELAIAVEELGRALAPGAFLPTVLASAILHGAGADALNGLVKDMAGGTLTGAVGFAPGIRATGPAATGAGATGTLVIDGACGPVPGAGLADVLILPAALGGEEGDRRWVVVDAADVEITQLDSLDLTRQAARVRADKLSVPPERVLDGLPPGAVTSLAAVLLAAEACGIADWAVATAAGYAKIRHQFGRPIGQFQAVKHRCAWMLTAAEQAAAAAWDAARAVQAGSLDAGGEFAAAVAALVAVDAAVSCAHECIQVLGGIGYTWEHDAHLYYRRALSLRALLGGSGDSGPAGGRARARGREPAPSASTSRRTPSPSAHRCGRNWRRSRPPAPPTATRRLAEGGWVVPHLPRPWGRGAGPLEQLIIAEEMRAAGLRAPGLAIGAWVVPALIQYGTPGAAAAVPAAHAARRAGLVPAVQRAGSRLRPGRADHPGRAGRRAGWRLTGQKIWTSLAKQAAWAICVARTDPAAPRHDGITLLPGRHGLAGRARCGRCGR